MAANIISQVIHGDFSITLDIYSFKEGDVFIKYSPALDISGYGRSEEEARDSIVFAVQEYLNYGIAKKTLVKDLRNHGWKVRSLKQRKFTAPQLDFMVNRNEVLRDILINRDYSKSKTKVEIPV